MFVKFKIPLEEKNISDRPPFLVIKNRKRPASATSVKFLDPNTLVCCSFLGRTLYLIHLDHEAATSRVLDSVETTYMGADTETDLCHANEFGQIVTSNFYKGTFTRYQRLGENLATTEDLGFKVEGFVHGIKYYTSDILVATATTKKTGVYFFDQNTCQQLLFIPVPTKTQDVCFLSKERMVVLTTHGAPKRKDQPGYHSDLLLYEFDLSKRSYQLLRAASYSDCHFDCAVVHDGQIFLTDQVNDRVKIFDREDLQQTGEIRGFSFPHGLDIAFGLMAVTNYGTNDIDILKMEDFPRSAGPILALRKFRYRTVRWLGRYLRTALTRRTSQPMH